MAGLNSEVTVTALTRKVGKDTEAFFNDEFWAQQVGRSVGLNG